MRFSRALSVRSFRAAVALLTVAAVSPLAWSASAVGAAAPTTVTTKPAQIPISAKPLPNSLRGQYTWSAQPTSPTEWEDATPDFYFRDHVPWSRVEPTQGTYDWSYFDDGMNQAKAKGGRFGFRVLAWCPGCFDNQYTHDWTKNSWVPSWLPTQGDTGIPDWNSEAFLSAWEDLMHHIAERYADDPALGWVDVGGFGKYGEWHDDGESPTTITVANAERLTRAVLDDFPKQHVVVNAMQPNLVNALLAMSPRLGLRTDCLGAPQMYSLIPSSAAGSLIAERWRTAPVMSEWCHANMTTTAGAKQVQKYHVSTVSSGNTPTSYASMSASEQLGFRQATQYAGYRLGVTSVTVPTKVARSTSFAVKLGITNTGSAPTYDEWDSVLQVTTAEKDATQRTVLAERTLPIALTSVLPGTTAFKVTTDIASGLKAGSYKLRIVVRDHRGYLRPMYLSQNGRTADGAYPLGGLTVG